MGVAESIREIFFPLKEKEKRYSEEEHQLQEIISVARQKGLKHRKCIDIMDEYPQRSLNERLAREKLYPHLRLATRKDYLEWLRGYIERGEKLTHAYKHSFHMDEWYVALKNIDPVSLYGVDAINIIVPTNIRVTEGDWGHCELFYMDGYEAGSWIPIYDDINFINF